MFGLLWLLTTAAAVASHGGEYVNDGDLARRFGVAESIISKSSKFKVECAATDDDFFNRFRDYDEVEKFLTELASKHDDGRCKLVTIGTSFEKRPIYSLELGSSDKDAPIILAMAGIHGREWTSIAALLFAMENLVNEWPPQQGLQINFIPIVNPDGYVRTFSPGTHTKEKYSKGELVTEPDIPNRYFRKNAHEVDLNRNFPANWGNDTKTKSLRLPASDVFQGHNALSEPETHALHKYAWKHVDRLAAMIDFHCCIGAVLAPPLQRFPGEENERVGKRLVAALSAGGKGVTRTVKNGDGLPGQYEWRPRDLKDRGAGLSSTWAFHTLALDRSYVVELRGKFVAPCFEIKQLGKEALFAMRALIKEKYSVVPLTERRRARLHITPLPQQQQQRLPNKRALVLLFLGGIGVLAFLRLVQTAKRKI